MNCACASSVQPTALGELLERTIAWLIPLPPTDSAKDWENLHHRNDDLAFIKLAGPFDLGMLRKLCNPRHKVSGRSTLSTA